MLKRFVLLAILVLIARSIDAKELPDFTVLVEKYGATVVNVSTSQLIRNTQGGSPVPGLPDGDPQAELFRRFASPTPREQETGLLGSGFIISADGYILTNAHVVDSADKITVQLSDQREFKARVIGADKRTDVALLKIEAHGLQKMTQGDPAMLKVGEWVLAIGSLIGFDNSVTAGIVSSKGRSLLQEGFIPFIQTDVAINPGNSGGPLLNMKGEVVGINSQIYSRSGAYIGTSLSIPIDVAMEVVNQLRTSGKVSRGRIGVVVQQMTRELADSFGLQNMSGALISALEKSGPAEKAGIQSNDVILKFDGKVVAVPRDLTRMVAVAHPGSKVNVQLWRKGATKEMSVMIGELPGEGRVSRSAKMDASSVQIARLGIGVIELAEEQKKQLEIEGGLLIDEAKGANVRAELQRGDIVLALGNTPIVNIEQLNNLLKSIPKGQSVALLVRRGEAASYIAIKLDEK